MNSDTIKIEGVPKDRFWIIASLVPKGRRKEHLFQMDLVEIFTFDNLGYNKRELRKSAKRLTSVLSKYLSIESRWKGEKKMETQILTNAKNP